VILNGINDNHRGQERQLENALRRNIVTQASLMLTHIACHVNGYETKLLQVVLAEADIPLAMATALKEGNLYGKLAGNGQK
jgi:uncharacterized protein YqfA (UPF0365 family)